MDWPNGRLVGLFYRTRHSQYAVFPRQANAMRVGHCDSSHVAVQQEGGRASGTVSSNDAAAPFFAEFELS
jgi:hypothetical protein